MSAMPPPQKSDCLPISCIEKRRNRPLGPLSRFFGGLILFIGLSAWTLPIKPELTPNSGEKGLLFEISGKGIKKPSYIFALNYWLSEEYIINHATSILPVIANADGFVTETSFEKKDGNKDFMSLLTIYADTPIQNRISASELKQVKKAFKTAGYGFDSIALVHPAILLSILQSDRPLPKHWPDGRSREHAPMEFALHAFAKSREVPTTSLEKDNDAMRALMTVGSETYFTKSLMDVVKKPKQFMLEMDSIRTAYVAQDLEKTCVLIERYEKMSVAQNTQLAKAFYDRVFTKMERSIKKGNHFFIIGAGKVGGSAGIFSSLKSKGYSVKATPVYKL